MQPLPFWVAICAAALLVVLLLAGAWRRRQRQRRPSLPAEWPLTARPVFSGDERRVYRQLREALPNHVVLSKLPLVRFCQPHDPQRVRYWYDLIGSLNVSFAICSPSGRVLAALDVDVDAHRSRRGQRIKESVLAACQVRYLRCAPHELPSIPELQLMVPASGTGAVAPSTITRWAAPAERDRPSSAWPESSTGFNDSFLSGRSRTDFTSHDEDLPARNGTTGR